MLRVQKNGRVEDCPGQCSLIVPENPKDYVFGKSSRGKKVIIPLWVSLDGTRYNKLVQFPNAQSGISAHSGAHGCVAAYEAAPVEAGVDRSANLPDRIALKCAPHGPKKKAQQSPWSSEWRIHNFLSGSLPRDDICPYVSCLGGVVCTVSRYCQVYFALELMDTDLFTVIEVSSTMPHFGEWILRALYSTCVSLQKLHDIGVVYCDLKPENVLINISNASAKFGDFDRSCVPGLHLGVVGGTKGYYSPERMRDSNVHTIADDVWAIGVLILIGSTTAASPYLDYTPETVHKFVPSRYLKRYLRCGWSPSVVSKMGFLCDRLLDTDQFNRAGLSLAVQVLGDICNEISDPTYSNELQPPPYSRFQALEQQNQQQLQQAIPPQLPVYSTCIPQEAYAFSYGATVSLVRPGSCYAAPLVIDDDEEEETKSDCEEFHTRSLPMLYPSSPMTSLGSHRSESPIMHPRNNAMMLGFRLQGAPTSSQNGTQWDTNAHWINMPPDAVQAHPSSSSFMSYASSGASTVLYSPHSQSDSTPSSFSYMAGGPHPYVNDYSSKSLKRSRDELELDSTLDMSVFVKRRSPHHL